MSPGLTAIVLLVLSNAFMTVAWYGHLKFKAAPIWAVVLVAWGIAFFEYCLQVPANRIGHAAFTAPQLKGIQEVISILVFAAFSTFYLGEPVTLRQWIGFALIIVAAFLIAGR